MNAKIRDAQKQKIPYMLVVGDAEVENQQVALRLRSGENPGAMPTSDFIARVRQDVEEGV
jgi:threonyl-tRNA synthetase